MIYGNGIDIIDINRIRRIIDMVINLKKDVLVFLR